LDLSSSIIAQLSLPQSPYMNLNRLIEPATDIYRNLFIAEHLLVFIELKLSRLVARM
jgi:hypothetical protein